MAAWLTNPDDTDTDATFALRHNDIDVPWWAFLLALPLIVALIALDVRTRKSGSTSGSGTNA